MAASAASGCGCLGSSRPGAMSEVVIDVRAVMSVVVGGKQHEVIQATLLQADTALAADLFVSEVANTAWKYHHIEELEEADAILLAEQATTLVDRLVPTEPMLGDAIRLSCQLDHPAYDCFYLLLARQHQAPLLTLDKKLKRLAEKLRIEV